MSVEESTPQQMDASAPAVDMVALYRKLIRIKHTLDEKRRQRDTSPNTSAAYESDATTSGGGDVPN